MYSQIVYFLGWGIFHNIHPSKFILGAMDEIQGYRFS